MSRETLTLSRRSFVAGTGATAIGASTLGGVASATETQESPADGSRAADASDPSIIAHRGFAGMYPENTVGALEQATRSNDADMVEVDVVPTADGEIVVFHDSKMSSRDGGTRGLTDLDGYIWDLPLSEVQSANVLGSGETVPTLREALDALPGHVGVNLEFKNPGTTDLEFAAKLSDDELAEQKATWRQFAEKTLDVAAEYPNDILVSSFYEAALAVVRDIDPSVPIGTLLWDSIETGLDIARTYDCEAIHPPYNMVEGTPFFGDEYYLSGPFADVDLVEVAHDEGRAVNTWTIGTWYQAEQLASTGVDGLICDYPGLRWTDEEQSH